MSTLATRIADLATRVSTECKALRTMINGNAADLSSLNTTAKTSLVAALNELLAYVQDVEESAGVQINDASTTSTTETYSVARIVELVSDSIAALTNGAPGALDQLNELAAALGNDENFAATVAAGLANRVRTDAAQGLTTSQKLQARQNIDAYGSGEIGDPDTNFVATFNDGLA